MKLAVYIRYIVLSIKFLSLVYLINPCHLSADPRLKRISSISINFSVNQNRLLVAWRPINKAARYRVTVQRKTGELVYSKLSSGLLAKFKIEPFSESEELIVTVKSSTNQNKKSSSSITKKYNFTTKVPTDAIFAELKAENSGGRKGVYFLPKNYRLKTLPVMLLFHGSSIDGRKIARIFREIAAREKFIIIAPDSVNDWGWEYSTDLNEPSEDQLHIDNCINEVLGIQNISIDQDKFLVAGVSAGAELAAFIGSNNPRFKSIAVMHGGVYMPGLGNNFVPIWLSTGTQDLLRPPSEVSSYIGVLKARSFSEVVYKEYDVGHAVPDQEKSDLIGWWLGSTSSTIN